MDFYGLIASQAMFHDGMFTNVHVPLPALLELVEIASKDFDQASHEFDQNPQKPQNLSRNLIFDVLPELAPRFKEGVRDFPIFDNHFPKITILVRTIGDNDNVNIDGAYITKDDIIIHVIWERK